MATAELLQDREIALQLHEILSEIDAARWRDEMEAALRARLAAVQAHLERGQGSARLAALGHTLRDELHRLEQSSADLRTRWLAFKQRLQPAYMTLAAHLRAESIHVPSLRPTNYARNLFHVGSASVALLAIEALRSPLLLFCLALAWGTFAWSMEILRRVRPSANVTLMKFFGPVAHPHETHRVNSATWYATALVLLATTGSGLLCAVAVAVLGVGDPMAAVIGRRFGRVKLMHGRSLEGTLGFLVSGWLIAFAVLRLFHAGALGAGPAALVALAAAGAGALAELASLRVDDNFSIPLSAASAAAVALWALGLPG